MWCVVRFGTICTILKVGKTTRRKKCNLQESLPKVTLLHSYFSCFLNCTIVTKSRNTFDMTRTYEVKVLWNTLRPFLHLLFRSVCPEFCSGIGHRIFFCIFLHEVTMSSNLKSDRAGFVLKKKSHFRVFKLIGPEIGPKWRFSGFMKNQLKEVLRFCT